MASKVKEIPAMWREKIINYQLCLVVFTLKTIGIVDKLNLAHEIIKCKISWWRDHVSKADQSLPRVRWYKLII